MYGLKDEIKHSVFEFSTVNGPSLSPKAWNVDHLSLGFESKVGLCTNLELYNVAGEGAIG